MTRRLAVLATAVVLLAGCANADWSTAPAGTVVDRGKRWVEIRQDDGRTVTHQTTKAVSRHCQVGERWPHCA